MRVWLKEASDCAKQVAVAQAKVGDLDGDRDTVKELGPHDNNVHPFALVRPAFAEALVRVGHTETAFKEADLIYCYGPLAAHDEALGTHSNNTFIGGGLLHPDIGIVVGCKITVGPVTIAAVAASLIPFK